MWRIKRITQCLLLAALLIFGGAGQAPVLADTTAVPSLTISQLKITSSNGQFVTLYNPTTSVLNMSNYQLEYFNSFDLSKATSSKLIALSGTLPPHSYFMVSDASLQLCYQMTVDSASLGFSSTAGMIEVLGLNQATPGGLVASSLQDYVGWSKTTANGAQTLPPSTSAFLQRQPVDAQNNPVVSAAGAGSWLAVQPDPATSCGLITAGSNINTSVASGMNQLLPASEPPAIMASSDGDAVSVPTISLPAADIGLMAPQITELLPNPLGTGNDATDEYIELYNANDVAFDLTGFTLESGLTTLHDYVFPAGSSLAAHSFTAFFAFTTKLTLSNTSGQVKLLDPFGNSLATTDAYSNAVDGQAWVLADGVWHWTTEPTPSATNVVKQAVTKTAKSKTSSSKASAKSSAAAKSTNSKKLSANPSGAKTAAANTAANVPIHPWALALVGGLALLYGVYEYRNDLGNVVRGCRAKLVSGGSYRPKFAWWRGDRAGE